MGVGEHHIYKLRNHPEGASFRAAWEAALDMGIQRIEDVAMDRALNGVDAPVFYHGEAVGTRKVYNDRLLMFLLNNRASARFAHGNARSQGSTSPRELARLKKQWRAEWEAERPRVSIAEVKASIDRKITELRRRIEPERRAQWARLSEETRDAWARFLALRDRDLAALEADPEACKILAVEWNADSDHFEATLPEQPRLAGGGARNGEAEADMPEVKQWKKAVPPPEPPPKTVWTLRDESFDP
jgi:hypothetical protein